MDIYCQHFTGYHFLLLFSQAYSICFTTLNSADWVMVIYMWTLTLRHILYCSIVFEGQWWLLIWALAQGDIRKGRHWSIRWKDQTCRSFKRFLLLSRECSQWVVSARFCWIGSNKNKESKTFVFYGTALHPSHPRFSDHFKHFNWLGDSSRRLAETMTD